MDKSRHFLDIGAIFLEKTPNFGQIAGLIPKNGKFDAEQPCFWTWLNPLGGLMADAQSGLSAFFFFFPPPPFLLPSLAVLYISLPDRLFSRSPALVHSLPPPPSPSVDHPPSADVAVGAFADFGVCALRAGSFSSVFLDRFLRPGPPARLRARLELRRKCRAPAFPLALARGAAARVGIAIRPESLEPGLPARFDRRFQDAVA